MRDKERVDLLERTREKLNDFPRPKNNKLSERDYNLLVKDFVTLHKANRGEFFPNRNNSKQPTSMNKLLMGSDWEQFEERLNKLPLLKEMLALKDYVLDYDESVNWNYAGFNRYNYEKYKLEYSEKLKENEVPTSKEHDELLKWKEYVKEVLFNVVEEQFKIEGNVFHDKYSTLLKEDDNILKLFSRPDFNLEKSINEYIADFEVWNDLNTAPSTWEMNKCVRRYLIESDSYLLDYKI